MLKVDPKVGQRLFAVIHLFGKQHQVTAGDMIIVENVIPVNLGQSILLNKCLLLGGENFSLIGRPVLHENMFKIQATIIEKTRSDTKLLFRHRPRSGNWKKYFFQSLPRTILRINSIELKTQPQ